MSKSFFAEDSGAVTVDWVVLTAAIVGLGLAVMTVVSDGVGTTSNAMADELSDSETIMAVASFSRGGSFSFSSYTSIGDWTNGSWAYSSAADYHTATASMSVSDLQTFAASYESHAANTSLSQNERNVHADSYAAHYDTLQSIGEDVSGMTHPDDVVASTQL